jgi:predicted metal-dependent hydrolase
MKDKVSLDSNITEYELKRSSRARAITIYVHVAKGVRVVAPAQYPISRVMRFVRSKAQWIQKKLLYFKKFKDVTFLPRSKSDYRAHKEDARQLIVARLEHFNNHYGFSYKKVFIRRQRSRWGSCSSKGNLSFNYNLIRVSPELLDYVVVHELCHLKELNHSKRFWDLVAERVPDWREKRRELRKIGLGIM